MASVQIKCFDHPVRCIPLTREVTTCGRSEECDVQLPHPCVSRRHCRIVRRSNQFFIENLESLGGFMVNDERFGDVKRLAHGDRIGVGDFVLIFENDSKVEAASE